MKYRENIATRTSVALANAGAVVEWESPHVIKARKNNISVRVFLTASGAFNSAYRIDLNPTKIMRTRKEVIRLLTCSTM